MTRRRKNAVRSVLGDSLGAPAGSASLHRSNVTEEMWTATTQVMRPSRTAVSYLCKIFGGTQNSESVFLPALASVHLLLKIKNPTYLALPQIKRVVLADSVISNLLESLSLISSSATIRMEAERRLAKVIGIPKTSLKPSYKTINQPFHFLEYLPQVYWGVVVCLFTRKLLLRSPSLINTRIP